MASEHTEADELLGKLLEIEPETDVITNEAIQLDSNAVSTLKASKTIWAKVDAKLLDVANQNLLNESARLLDIILRIAVAEDDESFATRFFTALESTVGMLTTEQLETFWPYLEHRSQPISEQAQGANSIASLRICRSVISRSNRELYSEQIGRVLQFSAVSKGFPHASRINKKGKKRSIKFDHLELVSSDVKYNDEFTPFKATEILSDINSLDSKDMASFAEHLSKKFKTVISKRGPKSQNPPASLNILSLNSISPDTPWDRLSVECTDSLVSQALVAFMTYTTTDSSLEAAVTKACDQLKSSLSNADVNTVENRVQVSEEQWIQWKSRGCPRIDLTAAPPLDEASQNAVPESTELPKIDGIIGNSESTQQLSVPFALDKFYVNPDRSNEITQIKASISTASDKQTKETLIFKSSRCQQWGDLVAEKDASTVVEHPEIAEQEERVQKELEEAKAPTPAKRSPSVPLENPSKRARLSYEDTAYTERTNAAEGTARPLPY